MMMDNPAALQFFMTEDIFLLKQDMDAIGNAVPQAVVADVEPVATATTTMVIEPVLKAAPVVIEATIVAEPEPIITKPEPPAATPVTEAIPPVIETPKPAFEYLGKNQKGFLIVFHSNGAGKFDDKHFAALTSSLTRKELSLDDVAIIDLHAHPNTTIADIAAYFKPARVMLLGSQCLLPGWHKLKLNVIAKGNAYTALYTYSFDEMMGDKDKVKAFWEQMKAL
jgi:hypothetical protein